MLLVNHGFRRGDRHRDDAARHRAADPRGQDRYVRRIDTRLRTLNTTWLLMIVLTPFATQLLTAKRPEGLETHALRYGFYSLVQLLDSVLLVAMLRHMATRRQLAGVSPRLLTAMTWRNLSPGIAFGVSIPVFFVTVYGWVAWFAVPIALHRLHRIPQPARMTTATPPTPARPGPPPSPRPMLDQWRT